MVRKPFYYEIGKAILFYWENEWRKGEIIKGYRTHDGIINVQLDDGKIIWCGEARHEEFIKQV